MAIAPSAVGTASFSGTGSTSFTTTSLTVGASDTLLIVGVMFDNTNNTAAEPTQPTGVSVTWNGVAMTPISGASILVGTWSSSSSAAAVALYGLVNPAAGNNNIVVSWTHASDCGVAGISFTGSLTTSVAAACPNGTTASGTLGVGGGGTTPITITTSTGDFAAMFASSSIGIADWNAAGTNTTTWADADSGPGSNIGSGYSTSAAAGSSVTLNISYGATAFSDVWGAVGVNITAGGGGAVSFTATALSAGSPIFSAPSLNVGSVQVGNTTLSSGLSYLHTNAANISLLSAQPANFAGIASNMIAAAAMGAGNACGTVAAAGTGNGLQIATAVANCTATTAGTAAFWSVDDGSNLLLSGPLLVNQSVLVNDVWQLPSFTIVQPQH